MNNFWSLVGFEYKKILKRKSMIIFILISICAVVLSGLLNINGNSYYHQIGKNIFSLEALDKDRSVILVNKGIIDNDLLKEVLFTTQQVLNDENNYFFDEKGYQRLKPETSLEYILPYYNIYYFLNDLYSEKFEVKSNEKPIVYLTTNDLDNFYAKYFNLLVENVDSNNDLSIQEKSKHIQMIQQIEMPFYNDYHFGYTSFKNMFPLVGMIVLTLISIVCSNIFGKEYSDKTISIILSSRYGKSKVIYAKIFTVISFSIIICSSLSILYLLTFLSIHGFTGANVAFQFIPGFAYSTYPITVLESVLISIVVAIFISMAFCSVGLLISTLNKNSLISLTIMLLMVFVPSFIPYTENRFLQQLINLFPMRIFDYEVIFSEYFYFIGSNSFIPGVFYIGFGALITVIVSPFICKNFKNHQVS